MTISKSTHSASPRDTDPRSQARRAPRARGILAAGVCVLAAAGAAWYFWPAGPDFSAPARVVSDERLRNPGDIIKFKGRYVATQVFDHRLAVFDDFELHGFQHFDPTKIGHNLKSPHFLAIAPDGGLLISDGWGSSIVEIDDLEGGHWREFKGVGKKFRAPHGICVDQDGWIYVGDSLNSRLVRFRDMQGHGWQVFPDRENRISYIRELVCRDGALLLSNSYENRPGLNPGHGSNILRITDFESGRAEIVSDLPDVNITGIQPLEGDRILVGLWGARRRLALVSPGDPDRTEFHRLPLGTPYGMYFDPETHQVLVAHLGRLTQDPDRNIGGIAVYR